MAEFTQIMDDWARMCKSYRSSPNGCTGCPLEDAKCYKELPCHMGDPNKIEDAVMIWANEHTTPVYPKWGQWFLNMAMVPLRYDKQNDWDAVINSRIPEWVAKRLDIAPINQ